MNGFLYRSARRAVPALGRACLAAVVITLVACGGGGSGGDRRPMADTPTSPTPIPTPTPTPTPDPTPTATPTPPPTDEGAPPATVLVLTPQPMKAFSFTWLASGGAAEYRLMEAITPTTPFVQVASVPGDVLSQNLTVFLPSKINASYVLQSCSATGKCSSSNVVPVTRDILTQAIGYIKASNTEPNPPEQKISVQANNDVLDISADGKTLVFGNFVEDGIGNQINGTEALDSDRENNSGAVYVLVNEGGVWSQQAYIKADNSTPDLDFGNSVSLSADGNTLAVGAIEVTLFVEGSRIASPRGAVYIFTRSGTTWSQQQVLRAQNADNNDLFGTTVSLADDGNTVAIGALGEASNGSSPNDNSLRRAGAAYVFTREGTTWTQQAYLKASNVGLDDQFGGTLALSGDGQTLVVTASAEDSLPNGPQPEEINTNSGAAYVFVRSGTTWSQQAFLKASTAQAGDFFGGSASLSRDGRTLAIGAGQIPFLGTATGPGLVFIFLRDDSNNWTQLPPIRAAQADNGDIFSNVSLTADGNTLLVGAFGELSLAKGINGDDTDNRAQREPNNAAGSGAAYLFTRNGTNWTQQFYLKASNTESVDGFGFAVAIAGDGSTVAVMAPNEDSSARGVGGNQEDNAATAGGGAVYLY